MKMVEEVLVSSEGGTELDIQEKVQAEKMNNNNTVMWERFLPKMAVRVLLVEADVSTRQIIAALLRKCSYKVAAVSDGLKAWELLQDRTHNVDLILTEVDLPSISGYALLSLIMEHDVCKNIPVIMMSSNDSVSTVYKCMLKGAADFLVKPLRKNELRNLWQHVWRKQSSSSATATGPGPPEETVAQQKVEATAETNAASNHSSGYIASLQRNRECIEKGSDAQSSCTKPDVETERTNTKRARSVSLPENDNPLQIDIPVQEEGYQDTVKIDALESQVDRMARGQDETSENVAAVQNLVTTRGNCSTEVIDFIGAFDNYLKGTFRSSATNANANNVDIVPMLDLSLRRSNQVNDERLRLNHSDASPFSRYINKPLQANIFSSPSTCNNQKDHESNPEKQFSSHTTDYCNSDTHGPTIGLQNHASVAKMNPKISLPYPQQREIYSPIPVRGVRIDINARGSVVPQMHCTQSPLPSHQSESLAQLYQFRSQMDQSDAIDHTANKKGQSLEDKRNVSLMIDQNGNSNFCNGKTNSVSVVMATSECGNEEVLPDHESASYRSALREVALRKFRLKRKDRCFDKKVRYESRKKLAEQRPRVKGQFVRQVANDAQSGNSSPV